MRRTFAKKTSLMANLPPPSSPQSSKSVPVSGTPSSSTNNGNSSSSVEQLILDLSNYELRENALKELSEFHKSNNFQELAPLLWHSVATIPALLQEVISVYPYLFPPRMTSPQSNRVCNALALFQCVASHADTKKLFLKAHLPMYLYPFLNTSSKLRPFEYLRLTSLGVIGSLVKVDDAEVIKYFLQTEIVPLCLRTMDVGSELSKNVAIFIIQKVLLDDLGLEYMCATADRFFALSRVLGNMVTSLTKAPSRTSHNVLKRIIRCYLRLTDNHRACDGLGYCIPDVLKDPDTFCNRYLNDDETALQWLKRVINNVSIGGRVAPGQGLAHLFVNQTEP